MSLADVQYQSNAHRHIQRAIQHDRLPHAYLFHGPDGVGKESFALVLAQLLLCETPEDATVDLNDEAGMMPATLRVGCSQCDDCRSTMARTHPDLHLVYRQLSRQHPDALVRKRKALDIGVDVLRHFLIDCAGRTPTRGQAKVFIVREADRMTPQAQNALLKTLEEPAGNAIIILLVTSLERLLPTTLSRCQTVRFDALPTNFIQQKITERHPDISEEVTTWYARFSAGSIGRALALLEIDMHALNNRLMAGIHGQSRSADEVLGFDSKSWIEESKSLSGIFRKRDPDISDTEAGRRALKTLMELASVWYADIVRAGCHRDAQITNLQAHSPVKKAAAQIPTAHAIRAVNRLASAARQLDLNANTQLCIETLINDLKRVN